jgi:hypothetical protein
MPKLVYRVVSACGALGYGYPKESLEAAINGRVDAIICDGGSMDAGPYYLGTGTEYRATGRGPELSKEALRESTIVRQMGIHPLMTALEDGAQYVIAGRSCDIALFASDMIRRGIVPGLAYHVRHVLECGALACDPSSLSDCLVAEIYDDNTAIFIAPNPARRCTAYSVAAHSLYEESHPQLQFYPEGHSPHGEDAVLLKR